MCFHCCRWKTITGTFLRQRRSFSAITGLWQSQRYLVSLDEVIWNTQGLFLITSADVFQQGWLARSKQLISTNSNACRYNRDYYTWQEDSFHPPLGWNTNCWTDAFAATRTFPHTVRTVTAFARPAFFLLQGHTGLIWELNQQVNHILPKAVEESNWFAWENKRIEILECLCFYEPDYLADLSYPECSFLTFQQKYFKESGHIFPCILFVLCFPAWKYD